MLKKLRELSSTTPISQLPEIYNYNNNVVTEEIDYFYDASNGRLIRSVYVPQGKVQAYTGEFRTLTVDSIQINNPTTLINNVVRRAADIPHNAFAYNFSNSTIEHQYENVQNDSSLIICHDTSVIAFPSNKTDICNYLNIITNNAGKSDTVTLYDIIVGTTDKLKSLDTRIKELEQWVEEAEKIPADSNGITEPANPDDYKNKPTDTITTYPKSYMYSTIVQLKRAGVNPLHINDLKNNNHLITYYPVMNPMIVNNTNYIGIECWQIGRVVNIQFKLTNEKNPVFMILLNRNNANGKHEYLKVTYARLNCLQLRCAGYTDDFGTVWDVYQWSGDQNNFEFIEV